MSMYYLWWSILLYDHIENWKCLNMDIMASLMCVCLLPTNCIIFVITFHPIVGYVKKDMIISVTENKLCLNINFVDKITLLGIKSIKWVHCNSSNCESYVHNYPRDSREIFSFIWHEKISDRLYLNET